MDDSQMDALTRFACRKRASLTSIAVVRLGQPFGSSYWRSSMSENIYKRIALDHDIIAQVKDITSVDIWMSGPWTYYRSVSSPLHNSSTAWNETSFPMILIRPLIGDKWQRNIRRQALSWTSQCKQSGNDTDRAKLIKDHPYITSTIFGSALQWPFTLCSLVWIVPMVVYASNVPWDARLKTQLLAIMAELREQ